MTLENRAPFQERDQIRQSLEYLARKEEDLDKRFVRNLVALLELFDRRILRLEARP